jgi:hypothetical protein
VAEYLDGARDLEYAEAPLLTRGARGRLNRKVPRMQQPARANALVIYFHTADNPFTDPQTTNETLDGAPQEEILMRAYGVPTKSATCRFPRFREELHVVPHEKIPTEGTRYHFVDPAASRNWFMLWVLVTTDGTHYVYREFPPLGGHIPEIGDPGEWALPDGRLADGRAGPAQESYGWGIRRYSEEIARVETVPGEPPDERGEPPTEGIAGRWMDSVFGNLPNQTHDGGTTLLEECLEIGLAFSPAPREHIDEGVSLINSLLDYERSERGHISKKPKLYFSDRCRNTIFALKLWSGRDGRMGASKDPIDCLRFMASLRLVAFTDADLNVYAGGTY